MRRAGLSFGLRNWKDYQRHGKICGIYLPPGLQESDRLPKPFSLLRPRPPTGHDENISFDETAARIGGELAEQLRAISLEIYRRAAAYAEPRGIILADTKFEFGLIGDDLIWIDEALTPGFLPLLAGGWLCSPGRPSLLSTSSTFATISSALDGTSSPPARNCPPDVVAATRDKYREAYRLLTGHELN